MKHDLFSALATKYEDLAKEIGKLIEPTFKERFCGHVHDEKFQDEKGIVRGCEERFEDRGVSAKQPLWNTGTD